MVGDAAGSGPGFEGVGSMAGFGAGGSGPGFEGVNSMVGFGAVDSRPGFDSVAGACVDDFLFGDSVASFGVGDLVDGVGGDDDGIAFPCGAGSSSCWTILL